MSELMTDRFALGNGSTPACNTAAQVFCGGDLQGIIDELDYIQGMGFDAVWISPVSAQILDDTIVGQAYHGYWASDLTKLGPSPTALQALSSALHDRSMALMLDVVVNHVAFALAVSTSQFDPAVGQSSTGEMDGVYGPFDLPTDYHMLACTIEDGNQTSVEQCWLEPTGSVITPDLNTSSSKIQNALYTNVRNIVQTYAIDGIRIDAAMHVEKPFLKGFETNAGVFCMGEVLNGDPLYVNDYQASALSSTLNYPMYFTLTQAFSDTSGSMLNLANMISTISYWFDDSTVLGGFASNHDMPRPRSMTTDDALLKNMFTYSFVADGIPIWYYGDEQNASGGSDPSNREALWTLGDEPYDTSSTLYDYVTRMNAVRKAAAGASLTFYTTKASVLIQTTHSIAISKYPLLSVLTNQGSAQSGTESLTIQTAYQPESMVVDVLSCVLSQVDSSGSLTVHINYGQPQVFMPLTSIALDPPFCADVASYLTCQDRIASRAWRGGV
ncbi:glycoside hydrolase family 13 protein [Phaffia rhodozyma]|uniref:alpha-amylase n=1 Tax=Phaffia rhodozyma TaxID=264483 RepID=A0A0F7SWE3_PHARH|nr:glycoside hydrolase family 13 protein [Phaffia rhodozyma]